MNVRLNRARRDVVVQNLLPALQGDRQAAEQKARQVFRAMAMKVADLWRFESGLVQPSWFNEQKDWVLFEAVHARGQGMLLVTPHLGSAVYELRDQMAQLRRDLEEIRSVQDRLADEVRALREALGG